MRGLRKAVLSWSGGKDCALALHRIEEERTVEIVGLLTTFARDNDGIERVPIHGVRRELIERQAIALDLPLHGVEIPAGATNIEYEARLAEALKQFRADGIEIIVFGDLFLEDIRAYREAFLARDKWQALFPLWRQDTTKLAQDFISRGFKSVVTSIDARVLEASFAGRIFDETFIADISRKSPDIDPCGENGEFHSFVFDAPLFTHPIKFTRGAVTSSDDQYFCDLMSQPL